MQREKEQERKGKGEEERGRGRKSGVRGGKRETERNKERDYMCTYIYIHFVKKYKPEID